MLSVALLIYLQAVSGSVSGEVKLWDFRLSSSFRTLHVQRSPMTALAVHDHVPMVATGSHAQFVKILTLDGDALQVMRYHKIAGGGGQRRIGPVSCLSFHPHKVVLAAGTDNIVSVYVPKEPILQPTEK